MKPAAHRVSVAEVLDGTARWYIAHARYEDFSIALPDGSVHMLWLDPPYFRVVDEEWDRAWKTEADFLAWLAGMVREAARVLAPTGSLYLFASPQMSGRVECLVREAMTVLNHVVWVKRQGWHAKADDEAARVYFPQTERVIFAEHPTFQSEALREYLCAERDRAGFTTRRVAEAFQIKSGSRTVTGMAGHWFERVQWAFPTAENYAWLRSVLNRSGEHEYLRREYEDLRRPFDATQGGPTTDVWTYDTVSPSAQKHPCEKPEAMLRDVVLASSRPGDVIAEFFGGSFRMAEAALAQGRRYLGCDADAHWAGVGIERARSAERGTLAMVPARKAATTVHADQLPLFKDVR